MKILLKKNVDLIFLERKRFEYVQKCFRNISVFYVLGQIFGSNQSDRGEPGELNGFVLEAIRSFISRCVSNLL